jgi:hypothetical protein
LKIENGSREHGKGPPVPGGPIFNFPFSIFNLARAARG